jgi:hypothetical protein
VSRRQRRRTQRTDEFWADRAAAAASPAQAAAVAFDFARARVTDLPAGEQAAAWAALTRHLDGFTPGRYSHANFASPGSEFGGPTRPAARGYAHAREGGAR